MRFSRIAYSLICALLLAACGRQAAPDQLQWAETALGRNPTLEVLASDARAGVITIRIKSTGEVRAVKLSELAAAPLSQLEATPPVAIASGNASPSQPASSTAAPEQAGPAAALTERAAAPLEQAPQSAEPSAVPPPASVQTASAVPSYTVERANGRVRVSGPGVSIVAEKAAASDNSGSPPASHRGLPIVCQGRKSMHVDLRTIEVDGDAVMASGGCDLYITNSRLTGTGAGIVIRDAIVHIDNSMVSGSTASIDADGGARLYTRGTTYHGLLRRSEQAQINDQGGNEWK